MPGKNFFMCALVCSLLWHILGARTATIIWPEKALRPEFSPVNFWGTILEKSGLDAAPESDNPRRGYPAANVAPLDTQKEALPENSEKSPLPSAVLLRKSDPDSLVSFQGEDNFQVAEMLENGLNRAVLFKPELPAYPDWAKTLGSYFEMQLKFMILPDGSIGRVDKVISSGYPELDTLGVRYVRKWRFVPLSRMTLQEEQWGIINIVFKLQ